MGDILNLKEFKKVLNNYTFTDYYQRLVKIALSLFEYENLPNNIKGRWIEKFLLFEGQCMFFEHPELGLMVAKCTAHDLNDMLEPIELRPVLKTRPCSEVYKNGVNAVLMRNDPDLMISPQFTLKLFAYRLAEITRTQDVNINAQKTPIIVLCDDKQKLTLKNLFNQYNGNELLIYGDKSLNLDNIKTLDTKAPIVFDKLETQKHHIWNEAMTYLGINNANLDKRERLVDDEVQANNGQVKISQEVLLKTREEFVNEINRIFRTNIKVKPRVVIDSELDIEKVMNDSEGGEVV